MAGRRGRHWPATRPPTQISWRRRENLLMRCWRGAMKTLPRIAPLILTLTVLTTIPAASPAASKNDGRPDGGTLAYGEYGRPATLDPITSNEMISLRITELVFNGLVGIDEKQAIVPELAERWEVSQDGRTYTFFLRKGVRWHPRDGEAPKLRKKV